MDEDLKMSLLKQFDEELDSEQKPVIPDSQIELNTDETVIEDDSNLPENKKYTDILKKYFGYSSFRKPQLNIIKKTIEEKRDQLVVMATGRGKSLCYQFPALYFKSGVTVVISPLISLMEDQVMSLALLNVEACLLGSAQNSNSKAEEDILNGRYKVLFITPEYIDSTPDFLLKTNEKVKINLLAIDECHCVSQWGDFFLLSVNFFLINKLN
jgi:Werner syndrome ATP-dependent helicase